MSRSVSVCLCAVLAFVALAGVRLARPAPALAATGTLTMETPLHESPDPAAPLIALLPEGTVVSIDGPPVNGFYPVTAGDLTGWMRGETMELQKDLPPDAAAGTPETEDGNPSASAQQTAEDSAPTDATSITDPYQDPTNDGGNTTVPDPAALTDPAPAAAATPDQSAADAIIPDQVADPASGDTATEAATLPLTADAMTAGAATPLAAPPVQEAIALDPTPQPSPIPTKTPNPTPTPGPSGPASARTNLPIRTGPGPDYGLIFTVPAGSTVEQTGRTNDGYVTVQYKEVSGWAPLDELGAAIEPTPEVAPTQTAVDPRTPKPGSGVAFTTVDLSLRRGPSASEAPVAAVPAGSRVVLTGVMEGGFQRVTYGDEIGWIADEFLATPADPEPDANKGKGKQENYTQREIVHIIYDAADRYDQSRSDMLRVAQCESNLDPYAVNPSGSYGLFQFIRTTWKSTPFGEDNIFDPRANANAAGWMWSQGRKSEWVCQ
jgi:uncharacterized protein YraI